MKSNFFVADTKAKYEMKDSLKEDHYCRPSLLCQTISNALILPSTDYDTFGIIGGGIVTENGEYVDSSAYAEGCCRSYEMKISNIQCEDETVVYAGFFLNCYGHGITDNIKKLWWLKQNSWEGKIIYITELNAVLPAWQKEIFRLIGIDCDKWFHITTPMRFRKVIIPDNSIINNNEYRCFTDKFRWLIDCIKANIPNEGQTYDKIYFTRTGIPNIWREYGERKIEKVFKQRGYQVISPEKLSVTEQIRLMMYCTHFASTEGSCAHNTLFCRPNTEVAILRKADYANSYQLMINKLAQLNITYIDIHHSSRADKLQPWHGPFYMCVTTYLAKYLDFYFYLPYWLHVSYWVYKRQAWSKYAKFLR